MHQFAPCNYVHLAINTRFDLVKHLFVLLLWQQHTSTSTPPPALEGRYSQVSLKILALTQ